MRHWSVCKYVEPSQIQEYLIYIYILIYGIYLWFSFVTLVFCEGPIRTTGRNYLCIE